MPPTIEDESLDSEKQQKKESAFFFGVLAGVALWISIMVSVTVAYFCCYKKPSNDVDQEDDNRSEHNSNYHNLPGQREQTSF